MWKSNVLTIIFALLFGGAAMAQTPHTPGVGSSERKMILDVLRVPFERDFKQPVKFEINHFKVLDNWAFVMGAPENAQTGKKLHAYADIDPNFCGLLRRDAQGGWTVVNYAAGFGDPMFASWPKKYGAPLIVFPEVIFNMQ